VDTKTRIKAARSRLGITQKVVADHCGVSITTVSKWEHGEALPQRGDNLDRLCELLKVSKPFLIWGEATSEESTGSEKELVSQIGLLTEFEQHMVKRFVEDLLRNKSQSQLD